MLKSAAGHGTPERKAGRILDSSVLLEAGLRLAGPEADAATTPLGAAKWRRDGAMVAMLALLPIRRRAFANLEIGTSIHFSEQEILVTLPEEMMKTGVPWEAPLAEPAASVLRRYVDDVRPWLMERGDERHDLLWVDDTGRPLRSEFLRHALRLDHETLDGSAGAAALLQGRGGDDARPDEPGGRAADPADPRAFRVPHGGAALHPRPGDRGGPGLFRAGRAAEERERLMRAAIYTRFSSHMQREASIEDQERLCRERAEREGWEVAALFADRAMSGASMLRPGLQALLEAASDGSVDVVLAEALDRLSRDQADIAACSSG